MRRGQRAWGEEMSVTYLFMQFVAVYLATHALIIVVLDQTESRGV